MEPDFQVPEPDGFATPGTFSDPAQPTLWPMGEADREDLMAAIYDLTPPDITREMVDLVVRAITEARANLLKASMPAVADPLLRSEPRIEIHGGEIITMKKRAASEGIDPHGNAYTEPEHYAVYTKMHQEQLNALEAVFGLPCKNG